MVDTVHLVVKNLSRHFDLVRFLESEAQDIIEMPYQPMIEEAGNGKYIHFFQTDRTYVGLRKSGKFYNSRYRDISYIIDETKDRILFNFSLTKYRYQTNVYQLIKDWSFNDFNLQFHSNLQNQFQSSFEVVFYQLAHFIKHVLQSRIRLEDIILHRIDLCYNHVFDTKEEKLQYFLNVKNFSHTSAQQKNFMNSTGQDSTVFWHSRKESFKIYDKEPEFATNDFKYVSDLVRKHAYPLSKKTLRFEWTIRHAALSELYKVWLYKHRLNKIYSYSSNPLNQSYALKYIKTLLPDKKRIYLKNEPKAQEAIKNKKFIEELTNKVVPIYLSEKCYPLEVQFIGAFSKQFYDYLLERFYEKLDNFFNVDFVKSHKSQTFVSLSKAMQKKILAFDALLKKFNNSYEQISPFYAERTFYKYKKLHKQTVLNQTVKIKLDFENYLIQMKTVQ